MKSTLLIFLVICAGAFGCKRDLQELDSPELQASRNIEGGNVGVGPLDPCPCGGYCRQFSVDNVLNTSATGTSYGGRSYHFAVTLQKTGDCSLPVSSVHPSICTTGARERWITMDWQALNAPNKLEDFAEIKVVPNITGPGPVPQGPGTLVMTNSDRSALYLAQDATVYFRWASSAQYIPTASQITTGGICIIGIITDPYFPQPGWGGRFPEKLERYGY